ncbi:MAG: hypothetical protein JW810_06910 [Sedimentisphaerales bacterium]|nr:hypothetical protein [Sedimentisphaerales bacterium]
MQEHVLIGFGFGPIQAALFAQEAYQSGRFARIVVAEVDPVLVEAVRAHGNRYVTNRARPDGIEAIRIDGLEIYNPRVPADRGILLEALAQATEIVTSLPSVRFYDSCFGPCPSVSELIGRSRSRPSAAATLVYTAENHNRAAEILQASVRRFCPSLADQPIQFVNTVIGKMSRAVTDPATIAELNLEPITPGLDRAFLAEQFNSILVGRCRLAGFRPGIEVFQEKDDLLPFEEVKLYGHNAIHALLAYLGTLKGYRRMTELARDTAIWSAARTAFLRESGATLIGKHRRIPDPLFSEPGFRQYTEDLLGRMTNPYLDDTVERAGRDLLRKLGPQDRLCGTMHLVIQQGIEPEHLALGALAALALLLKHAVEYDLPPELRCQEWQDLSADRIGELLAWIWQQTDPAPAAETTGELAAELAGRIEAAREPLRQILES